MTAPNNTQRRLIVAGTDTDVGKTVFAAALTSALDGCYWKPVQAGCDGSDAETVRRLSGLPCDRILPEAYKLRLPAAPEIAAAAEEGVVLDPRRLANLPAIPDERTLVIETAGGLLVPMAPDLLQIDLLRAWAGDVVLVSRTALGTINHTLLSLEALRARGLPILGVAFVGAADPDAEASIVAHGRVKRLGRLPRLPRLDEAALAAAFAANFDVEDFAP